MSDSVFEGTGSNSPKGGHRTFANLTMVYGRTVGPQIDSTQSRWTERTMTGLGGGSEELGETAEAILALQQRSAFPVDKVTLKAPTLFAPRPRPLPLFVGGFCDRQVKSRNRWNMAALCPGTAATAWPNPTWRCQRLHYPHSRRLGQVWQPEGFPLDRARSQRFTLETDQEPRLRFL